MTVRLGPGELLVVSRDEVEQLLTPTDCLERVLDTFRWVGQGEVTQVNPVNLYVHDRTGPEPEFGHGLIQAFPALIRPINRAAVKWLGSYRRNPDRGLPAISAVDLLSDSETGMPLAMIDGTSVTNMRTGAHAAVGAKYLAQPESSVIAIIGCGNEGRTHVRHLDVLFDIAEIRAFDINRDAIETFIREMREHSDASIVAADSVDQAVNGAHIVCVVTTSPRPVLMEASVGPGTHVCAATGFRDVDPECATRFDKWVVGWYERDLEWIEGTEAGRIGGLQPGQFTKADIHADIADEIIRGVRPGREGNSERTVMTHLGMPALDAAVASLVYTKAIESGVGRIVRIF